MCKPTFSYTRCVSEAAEKEEQKRRDVSGHTDANVRNNTQFYDALHSFHGSG